jgi:hypothetical protein
MENKNISKEKYIEQCQQAKEIIKSTWRDIRNGSQKERADLFFRDVPMEVQIKTNWTGEEYPYAHITLPDKKVEQIERGFWFIFFNASLTRYVVIKNEVIPKTSYRGWYSIPLDKVEFREVNDTIPMNLEI